MGERNILGVPGGDIKSPSLGFRFWDWKDMQWFLFGFIWDSVVQWGWKLYYELSGVAQCATAFSTHRLIFLHCCSGPWKFRKNTLLLKLLIWSLSFVQKLPHHPSASPQNKTWDKYGSICCKRPGSVICFQDIALTVTFLIKKRIWINRG